MLEVTIFLFCFYVVIQLMYIFYPLYTATKSNPANSEKKEKGISVVIPAYNEEKIILNCLKGIENLNYKNYEIIFVNDGSTDHTLNLLINQLDFRPDWYKLPALKIPHEDVIEVYRSRRFPKLYLIDKKNGGKADALNAGAEYAAKEIVVTLDADSILDPASLQAMNHAFDDPALIAGGGMVQIKQGFDNHIGTPKKPNPMFQLPGIVRYQILQYMTAFYLHKFTQSRLQSIFVIAGAFGAFRKQALYDANGYRRTVGEDMDVTLKIHKLIKTNPKYKHKKLTFIPEALCYTECPETFSDLLKQRIRWQKGFVDCVLFFKKAFFSQLGFRLSFLFLFEFLLLGTINAFPTALIPVFLLFNLDNYMVAVALFSTNCFLAITQSLTTVFVSERFGLIYPNRHFRKFLFFIPIETITYRLLGLVFVITGTISYFKNKDGWYVSKRIGNAQDRAPLEEQKEAA